MKHIIVKLLALIALAGSLATTARAESFAKRVDIGGGRMMYIECQGSGSPTVLLISGTDNFDEILDQTASAAALRPMPVVVLTASDKFIDVVPKLIQAGELPPDLGAVLDRANPKAQNELAALVPGAVHITDTHSGHNIMIDNAPVVIQAIRMVVDAVRAGHTLAQEVTH